MRAEVASLRPVAPDLFAADMDAYDMGIHIVGRMTVAKLADGGLWLCSPVPIDDALAAELLELGEVRHIVAPNLGHHLFAAAAKRRFEEATLWGAPGLAEKLPDLPVDRRLEDGFPFGAGLEAKALRGVSFLNEVVFHHEPSSTLICTDFVHNVHEEPGFATRMLWHALGTWRTLGMNRRWRWKSDRAPLAQSVEEMRAWEADRIVMAHGDIVPSGGAAALSAATAWLRD